MLAATPLAAAVANRWLLAFSFSLVLVVVGSTAANRLTTRARARAFRSRPRHARIRRRAGAVVALGPVVGLAFAPSPDKFVVTAVVGGAALAGIGWITERDPRADALTLASIGGAALVVVGVGLRWGPTGFDAFDVLGAC